MKKKYVFAEKRQRFFPSIGEKHPYHRKSNEKTAVKKGLMA